MHDCPVFWMRAATPVFTAPARSALGITIKGSLPPNSRTLFLICRAAALATSLPARSLPVRVTAFTRTSSITERTCSVSINNVWKTPTGNPARRKTSSIASADCDTKDLPEGKIPRHERQHRTDRFVANKVMRRFRFDLLFDKEPFRVLRVKPATAGAFRNLRFRRGQQLPHFERHDSRQPRLVRFEQIRGGVQPIRPLRERRFSIRSKSLLGRPEFFFQLVAINRRKFFERFAGRRIGGGDHGGSCAPRTMRKLIAENFRSD